MKRLAIVVAICGVLAGCSTTRRPTAELSDSELRSLETAKWNPQSLGSRDEFMALFAEDFVSVEYGSDVQGGVHRKTRAEVFSGPPLPPASFELSEWHFVHADRDVVIVSYRVKGLTFPWNAYATSVWSRRNGKWQTVFYQASSTS